MAVPSNTYETYDIIGQREELTDAIYNVAPTETPFMSNAPTGGSSAVKHEWQTDDLSAAAATPVIEGDDATTDASTPTVRLNNYHMIQDKVARVSGTSEATDRAGRQSEMAYQIMKRSKELKRDMEVSLVGTPNAKVAGSSGTARELGSVQTWLATNTNRGTGGADPTGDGSDVPTNGTQRVFTETILGDVIDQVWNSGGNPDIIMTGSFNKRALNAFTGHATEIDHTSKAKSIINAVSMYISDFGEMRVVPNRFIQARDCLVYQKDMFAIHYLRQFRTHDLAKTGDSERKQLLVEYTLESRNEKASGIAADLTTS